jgi:acyl-CoA thioesterase-1
VGIDEYRQNLYIIAGKIKQKTTRPLFILTTEVLPGTPYRSDNNVITYNQVAIEVMNDLGIQVLDLYSISKEIPDFHVDPHDVHYTQQGYEYLANAVYQGIINL